MDMVNSVGIINSSFLDTGDIVNTFIGAFLGAFFAYLFAVRVQKWREHTRRISAVNRAVFVLSREAGAIAEIKKQAIDPYRENPERIFNMKPFQHYTAGNVKFDVESLEFILETEHKQLLSDLLVVEEQFNATIQPLIEKAINVHSSKITFDQIKEFIGRRLFITLRDATEELIKYVDDTLVNIYTFQNKFVPAMKRLYPRAKFIQFEKEHNSED